MRDNIYEGVLIAGVSFADFFFSLCFDSFNELTFWWLTAISWVKCFFCVCCGSKMHNMHFKRLSFHRVDTLNFIWPFNLNSRSKKAVVPFLIFLGGRWLLLLLCFFRSFSPNWIVKGEKTNRRCKTIISILFMNKLTTFSLHCRVCCLLLLLLPLLFGYSLLFPWLATFSWIRFWRSM